jgi:hypothetical protein
MSHAEPYIAEPAWARSGSPMAATISSITKPVACIGVLLEPQVAVGHVHQHAAEGAAQRLRERQVVGRVALVDVEPSIARERGRVEPAALAADVVSDEEVRAILRDAADLAAFEATRTLGTRHTVPPP